MSATDDVDALHARIQKAERFIRALEQKNVDTQQRIKTARIDTRRYQDSISAINRSNQALRDELENLQGSRKQLSARREAADRDKITLEESIREIQSDVNITLRTYRDANDRANETITVAETNAANEESSAFLKLKQLQDKLHEIEAIIETLKHKLEERQEGLSKDQISDHLHSMRWSLQKLDKRTFFDIVETVKESIQYFEQRDKLAIAASEKVAIQLSKRVQLFYAYLSTLRKHINALKPFAETSDSDYNLNPSAITVSLLDTATNDIHELERSWRQFKDKYGEDDLQQSLEALKYTSIPEVPQKQPVYILRHIVSRKDPIQPIPEPEKSSNHQASKYDVTDGPRYAAATASSKKHVRRPRLSILPSEIVSKAKPKVISSAKQIARERAAKMKLQLSPGHSDNDTAKQKRFNKGIQGERYGPWRGGGGRTSQDEPSFARVRRMTLGINQMASSLDTSNDDDSSTTEKLRGHYDYSGRFVRTDSPSNKTTIQPASSLSPTTSNSTSWKRGSFFGLYGNNKKNNSPLKNHSTNGIRKLNQTMFSPLSGSNLEPVHEDEGDSIDSDSTSSTETKTKSTYEDNSADGPTRHRNLQRPGTKTRTSSPSAKSLNDKKHRSRTPTKQGNSSSRPIGFGSSSSRLLDPPLRSKSPLARSKSPLLNRAHGYERSTKTQRAKNRNAAPKNASETFNETTLKSQHPTWQNTSWKRGSYFGTYSHSSNVRQTDINDNSASNSRNHINHKQSFISSTEDSQRNHKRASVARLHQLAVPKSPTITTNYLEQNPPSLAVMNSTGNHAEFISERAEFENWSVGLRSPDSTSPHHRTSSEGALDITGPSNDNEWNPLFAAKPLGSSNFSRRLSKVNAMNGSPQSIELNTQSAYERHKDIHGLRSSSPSHIHSPGVSHSYNSPHTSSSPPNMSTRVSSNIRRPPSTNISNGTIPPPAPPAPPAKLPNNYKNNSISNQKHMSIPPPPPPSPPNKGIQGTNNGLPRTNNEVQSNNSDIEDEDVSILRSHSVSSSEKITRERKMSILAKLQSGSLPEEFETFRSI